MSDGHNGPLGGENNNKKEKDLGGKSGHKNDTNGAAAFSVPPLI